MAIIKCVKEWDRELRGLQHPFTILTDHENLKPFMTKRALTERQMRWAQILSKYNFRLDHRPGRKCVIPDALSRREQDMPKDASDDRIAERNKILLPESLWLSVNVMEHVPTTKKTPVATQLTRSVSHFCIQDATTSRDITNPFENAR